MHRTRRQLQIDRALAGIVQDASPYLLPEAALREEIFSRIIPRPSTTEVDEALRHADTQRRLVSVESESGRKYKLSEIGQAWLAEQHA